MQKLKNYISLIDNAINLSSKVFNEYDTKLFNDKRETIINALKENAYVKVPFVGNFSAGKSTLLNYLINKTTFLPTSINPTTAVSYELYFDTNERLEIFNDLKFIYKKEISEINALETESGFVVKVFIDNDIIKKYSERNIVLVDMPGIDSGYNEHQAAIFNYISKGTSFVIVNDIEAGTLQKSTINFIKEIEKYNLKSIILLSKSDKKSPTEREKILGHVTEIANNTFSSQVPVNIVSSVENDINPLINFLDSIEATEIFEIQNKPIVLNFLNEIIQKLEIQKNVLGSNKDEIKVKIQKLENEKIKVEESLKLSLDNLQPVSESVSELLNDVSNALKLNTSTFATLLEKNASEEEFGNQVMSIVRPFLVEKSEKYANNIDLALGNLIGTFEKNVNNFFGFDLKDMIGQDQLKIVGTQVLKKGTNQLGKVFNPAMLQKAGTLLMRFKVPVVLAIGAVVVGVSLFFKNKKENEKTDNRESLKRYFSDTIVGDIIGKLRNDVTTVFETEKEQKVNEIRNYINNKIKEIEDSISVLLEEQSSKDFDTEIINIDKIILEITNLKEEV